MSLKFENRVDLSARKERLSIEVTTRCNSACSYCFVRAGASKHSSLSVDIVKEIIVDGFSTGYRHLHITGGEPLLWEGLFEILDYAFEIGFKTILAMADTGRAVVKLSGAFRESRQAYPFSELDPFAEAILKAFTPQNCLWGSDWPFLNFNPKPDYRQTLTCLERWLPNEDQRRQVLWDTPVRLFDFS